MARYKKRKDGRYATTVVADGKKRYVTANTITELERKVAEIKTDSARGTYADDKGYTFKQWLDKWLSTYRTNISEATRINYKRVIDVYFAELHDIRLKNLTKTDLQEQINKRNSYDPQRLMRLVASSAINAAITDGLLYKDVTRDLKIMKKPKTNTRALTSREKASIQLCDFTAEEKAFVYLLQYTGMRPEEIRALTKNDIDLANKTIDVNKAVSFEKNKSELTTPKTDSGYRTIPILSTLESPLRDYLNELDNLYLFTKTDGNLHTKRSYRTFWEKIFQKINVQMGGTQDTTHRTYKDGKEKRQIIKGIRATDLTPYVFRHNFATMLYYSGIDIKEAARIMGHADTKMMLEVYAELDEKQSNSVSKLEQYLKNS